MTYNVFGGTLNLAQLNSVFCCADIENSYFKMSEEAKHLPTAVDSEITGFDSSKLKHTECHEKTSLPTADGIDLLLKFCVYGITGI